MKNNKPWYEKVSIWITIVSGICAILGISAFGGNYLIKDDKAEDIIRFENNEIGEKATVIVGDGNTINYGNVESGNMESTKSDDLSDLESKNPLITVSYNMNTPQTASDGVNVLVEAETSFPAERVTISAISDKNEAGPMDMHGDLYNWQFVATFYIKGTYTVTVTAYKSDGESVSEEFTYVY